MVIELGVQIAIWSETKHVITKCCDHKAVSYVTIIISILKFKPEIVFLFSKKYPPDTK